MTPTFFTPEVLSLLADVRTRDTAASALVARLRQTKPKTHPQVEYRCELDRCLLLAGWHTPAGIVCNAAAFRVSARQVTQLRGGPQGARGATLDEAKASYPNRSFLLLHESSPEDRLPSQLAMPAETVLLACRHLWMQVAAEDVREDVRIALRRGRRIDRVVGESGG